MAGTLVRKPSNTPNITNYDDTRMLRYATGGYNGVVEKHKNECSYTVNGSIFKINSGEIIIDGWQYGIDASGESITIDNISGTQYYSVYLEIDLSIADNQKGTIKSTYDTVSYPIIDAGDDLTEAQTGVARLELYKFTASSGVISNVSKSIKTISYSKIFDVIVKTQAEFEALIASPTWFDAKSVAFIGDGGTLEFELSTINNNGILIPENVYTIQGFNNAVIVVDNNDFIKPALYYDTLIERSTIKDITIIGHCRYGFSNCKNLINCISILPNREGLVYTSSGYGFSNCKNLINCISNIEGQYTNSYNLAYGFYNCINIVNCYSNCIGTDTGVGFYDCTGVLNSEGIGNGGSIGYSAGFRGCLQVSNCIGTGVGFGNGALEAFGFTGCSQINNCVAKGTGTTGYGYNGCSYGSCNKDDGSTTASTGGTMTKWSSETND